MWKYGWAVEIRHLEKTCVIPMQIGTPYALNAQLLRVLNICAHDVV